MIKTSLSTRQKEIVEHEDGALLVVAGPGTGKTRVLTERVRRLLTEMTGHFRVLALTFTNKAANEMIKRLSDLGDVRQRATISTLHGFCLEVLADRGKPIGVSSQPQIFEQNQDRKQVLVEAVMANPMLTNALLQSGDQKKQNYRLNEWLLNISFIKNHPISHNGFDDPLEKQIFGEYNARLRACGAYDFDDLLLLTYQLLTDFPQVANLYRRLYGFICIDESQDLNEAQYAVLTALCGGVFQNVMMVGDPKQSIYGFNKASPKYMKKFLEDFKPKRIELTDNFRSSLYVVEAAKALNSRYTVQDQLPIRGEFDSFIGEHEEDESKFVCGTLQQLFSGGHGDIEGTVMPSRCAILGRTRYSLLKVEKELKAQGIPFFKRLSSSHENESEVAKEFQLALRVFANPRDILHLTELARGWEHSIPKGVRLESQGDVISFLQSVSERSNNDRYQATVNALNAIAGQTQGLDLFAGIKFIRQYADSLEGDDKRIIYDDTQVLMDEWDQYQRSGKSSNRSIAGFMSSMALGTTQQVNQEGVALLTVHSAKGLEFDVVFIVDMADGVFPDYRARGNKISMEEERRNAFVAVTRSKRLLYISYSKTREMPWGETWRSQPSQYFGEICKGVSYL